MKNKTVVEGKNYYRGQQNYYRGRYPYYYGGGRAGKRDLDFLILKYNNT